MWQALGCKSTTVWHAVAVSPLRCGMHMAVGPPRYGMHKAVSPPRCGMQLLQVPAIVLATCSCAMGVPTASCCACQLCGSGCLSYHVQLLGRLASAVAVVSACWLGNAPTHCLVVSAYHGGRICVQVTTCYLNRSCDHTQILTTGWARTLVGLWHLLTPGA